MTLTVTPLPAPVPTLAQRRERLAKLYQLRRRLSEEIKAEREALNAAEAAPNPSGQVAAECGTESGYYRHVRGRREPACLPCRKAHAKKERDRAARRAAAAADLADEHQHQEGGDLCRGHD